MLDVLYGLVSAFDKFLQIDLYRQVPSLSSLISRPFSDLYAHQHVIVYYILQNIPSISLYLPRESFSYSNVVITMQTIVLAAVEVVTPFKKRF